MNTILIDPDLGTDNKSTVVSCIEGGKWNSEMPTCSSKYILSVFCTMSVVFQNRDFFPNGGFSSKNTPTQQEQY